MPLTLHLKQEAQITAAFDFSSVQRWSVDWTPKVTENTPRTTSLTKQRIKGKSSWPFAPYSAFNSAQKSQSHTVGIRCLWYTHHQFFGLYSEMNVSCSVFPSNHSWKREKGSLEAPAISSWYLSHRHRNSNFAIPQVISPHRFEFTNCSTSLKYIPHTTGMPLYSSPAWSQPSLLWCAVKDSFP